MSAPAESPVACSRCARLEPLVVDLEARVAALEAQRATGVLPEPPLPETAEDPCSVLYPLGLEARRRWL